MKNFNQEDNLIEIIFEDDFIIVINKKNGLLSHCNKTDNSISVVSILKKYNKKLRAIMVSFQLHFVFFFFFSQKSTP